MMTKENQGSNIFIRLNKEIHNIGFSIYPILWITSIQSDIQCAQRNSHIPHLP